MSQDSVEGIAAVHNALGEQIVPVTQNALSEVENMALNAEQAQKVQNAFNGVVNQVEEQVVGLIEDAQQGMNDGIDNGLNNIEGLPEEARVELAKIGKKVVNDIASTALNAVKESAIEVKELADDAMKQVFGAVKAVFSNVGAVITKEKTPEQALADVKEQFQETGQSIGKAVKSFATSFVEKLGLGNKKEQGKTTHVQKLQDQQQNSQSQDKGGRG